jgi:putative ABC transport system permease protein
VRNLRATPLGFEPERLLYANVEPRTGGIPNSGRRQYFAEAVNRVAAIPGVISASATDDPPLSTRATLFVSGVALTVCTPGYVPAATDVATTEVAGVAPRFFETIGTRVVAGREFDRRDLPVDWSQSPRIAVVNEAFARTFFATKDPLDQRFGVGECPSNPTAFGVIGVVADVKNGPRDIASPTVYLLGDLYARGLGRRPGARLSVPRVFADGH